MYCKLVIYISTYSLKAFPCNQTSSWVCLIVALSYRWVGVAHKGVNDSVKTMSLRLSEESQLTKSAYEFSKSRKDPAFQSWISKGGPGLSSQSQHIKPDKKLPPHPDFALKGADPVKRVRCILSSI